MGRQLQLRMKLEELYNLCDPDKNNWALIENWYWDVQEIVKNEVSGTSCSCDGCRCGSSEQLPSWSGAVHEETLD